MSYKDYDDDRNLCITEKEWYAIMKSTLLKYKLLRLRCKISFEAFVQSKTISELIIRKVQDTYNDLVTLNEFILPYEYIIVKDEGMIESLLK